MSFNINFASETEAYTLLCAVWILILTECCLLLFTIAGHIGKKQARNRSDRGTTWLIIIGYYFALWGDFYFRSTDMPASLQSWMLPYLFFYVGLFLAAAGIVIRCAAVFTLKRAFTFTVQTAGDQHLIQTGLYGVVRNPAYTGSLISLLGVALAFRNIFGIPILIVPFLCYAIRIRVEEKALNAHFQEEFSAYCRKTRYRLFPAVY